MKFDLSKPVLQAVSGQPIVDSGTQKAVEMGDLLIGCLIANLPEDVKLSDGQKIQVYKLKQKILSYDKEEIGLDTRELNILRGRASKVLSIDTFGQLSEFLDNPLEEEVKCSTRDLPTADWKE